MEPQTAAELGGLTLKQLKARARELGAGGERGCRGRKGLAGFTTPPPLRVLPKPLVEARVPLRWMA